MSKNNVTSLWECKCSSKNPLRFRKCKTCGCDMPESFANMIYCEVLREKNALVFIENQVESERRCFKFGNFLERAKNVVVPIMVVLVIALNVGRIYWDSSNISNYISENMVEHRERLLCELDNTNEKMNGLKSTSVVVETIFSDIFIKIMDVSKDLSAKWEESEKNINYRKIYNVRNKIERATEYVTSKFE